MVNLVFLKICSPEMECFSEDVENFSHGSRNAVRRTILGHEDERVVLKRRTTEEKEEEEENDKKKE